MPRKGGKRSSYKRLQGKTGGRALKRVRADDHIGGDQERPDDQCRQGRVMGKSVVNLFGLT